MPPALRPANGVQDELTSRPVVRSAAPSQRKNKASMLNDHLVIDPDDVEPILRHDGREQIQRLVTNGKHGFNAYSFHIVHFDPGLEKDMIIERDREIVYLVLQGSAVFEWGDGQRAVLRPGLVFVVAPYVKYRHITGALGMTIAAVDNPPSE